MIEEVLINQGVAGAMLIYFMYDKISFQKKIEKLIESNTSVILKSSQMQKQTQKIMRLAMRELQDGKNLLIKKNKK